MNKKLHQEAIKARANAYSPYSKIKVGAALTLSNGKVYSGCNVENASYGGTVCAERVAIWKALSENPTAVISEMVVVTDAKEGWPPCGFCRQVIVEFSNKKTKIHTGNLKEVQNTFSVAELLPAAFGLAQMKKK